MKRSIVSYLDWAASAPVSPRAKQAFLSALPVFGNPSSAHEEGRRAKEILERARETVAREAGVKSDSVIFTSGATEANALLISGRIEALKKEGRAYAEMRILYAPGSHASVTEAVEREQERGVVCEPLPISHGAIGLEQASALFTKETVLVLVDLVESETGAMFDTRGLRRMLDERFKDVPVPLRPVLHIDASQAPWVESIALPHTRAHTLSLDAQKIGGVRGAGALICPRTIPLVPLISGGGQERGLRSGTEAVALVASFSEALAESGDRRDSFLSRARRDREFLIRELMRVAPQVQINQGHKNAPHILNISLPGRDTDYLQALLDSEGIAVSTKSACETDEPYSRAVLALTGDEARARATLRISWGFSTRPRECKAFIKAFSRVLPFLEASAL